VPGEKFNLAKVPHTQTHTQREEEGNSKWFKNESNLTAPTQTQRKRKKTYIYQND
jgi:hypothetical protein